MASIEDYYDNGILKSLLAKVVNDSPVPIYPRSSAEIIEYEDTTVKAKLDNIDLALENISALIDGINITIDSVSGSRYDKTHIDSIISSINTNISRTQDRLANIEADFGALDVYNKNQVNDFISRIETTVTRDINTLTASCSRLEAYVINNYYTRTEADEKHAELKAQVDALDAKLNGDFNDAVISFKEEITNYLTGIISEYYSKADIDTMIATMTRNISTVNTAVEDLREETTSMNETSVNTINNHSDDNKTAIIDALNLKLNSNLESIDTKLNNQTQQFEALLQVVTGAINTINSSVGTQIAEFLETGGPDAYENADEEAF